MGWSFSQWNFSDFKKWRLLAIYSFCFKRKLTQEKNKMKLINSTKLIFLLLILFLFYGCAENTGDIKNLEQSKGIGKFVLGDSLHPSFAGDILESKSQYRLYYLKVSGDQIIIDKPFQSLKYSNLYDINIQSVRASSINKKIYQYTLGNSTIDSIEKQSFADSLIASFGSPTVSKDTVIEEIDSQKSFKTHIWESNNYKVTYPIGVDSLLLKISNKNLITAVDRIENQLRSRIGKNDELHKVDDIISLNLSYSEQKFASSYPTEENDNGEINLTDEKLKEILNLLLGDSKSSYYADDYLVGKVSFNDEGKLLNLWISFAYELPTTPSLSLQSKFGDKDFSLTSVYELMNQTKTDYWFTNKRAIILDSHPSDNSIYTVHIYTDVGMPQIDLESLSSI